MDDEYYESKKLASCFLVQNSESIKIPPEIYQELHGRGKNMVGVIPGDSKKLTFFLTDAGQILFVRLFLHKDRLDDSFFTSLRNTLKELGMTNLFSTGLCFKEQICVWEGVFEYENDANYATVEDRLSQVLHVNKAKLEKIKLTQ
jgi:hypothetical protein